MQNLKGRKLADSVSSVGSMLLFLIFAACSLIIICTGASTYSRISKNYRSTFSSSAAVRYVTNKIRSCDSAELSPDGRAVAVFFGSTVCVISSGNGGVCERNAMVYPDEPIEYSGGDIIFADTSLEISCDEDGIYSITAVSGDDAFTVCCRGKEG